MRDRRVARDRKHRAAIRLIAAAIVALAGVCLHAGTRPSQAAEAAEAGSEAQRIHVVARGEDLFEIARGYDVSADDLRLWNRLTGDRLRPGLRLRVSPPPGWDESSVGDASSAPPPDPGPPGGSTGTPGTPRTPARSRTAIPPLDPPAPPTTRRAPPPTVHVVRRGENLTEIAQSHGTRVSDLKDINELESDRIFVGQILRLQDPEPVDDPDRTPPTAEEPLQAYIVQRGDNLTTIARRFDMTVPLLRQLNDLKRSRIYPGQKLKLRPGIRDHAVHVVRSGDTLSGIASRYGSTVRALRDINGIDGSRIFVGQRIRLRTAPAETHVVQTGDALWEIARTYGMSVAELKRLNGLTSSRIYPGQEIKTTGSAAPRLERYRVRRGDSLSEIAQLHGMTLGELRGSNEIRGSVIHPGQILNVRPILGRGRGGLAGGDARGKPAGVPGTPFDGRLIAPHEIDWAGLVNGSGATRLTADNGPYFSYAPRAERQRSRTYLEESPARPMETYRRARKLFETFERNVAQMGRLGRRLEGWHVVLDPGHGGIDPGSITKVVDGRGDPVYVVEDEYVYDIALRMYALLRLHGADVTLTLLSPNHLMRQSNPPTQTFVHQRDEVFNSASYNRKNGPKQWPKGGQRGLTARVDIAREAFAGVPTERRIFISLHADYSPGSPNVPLVLYYANSRRTDKASRRFAKALLPALGAGAQLRGQRLEVLRANPAAVKVLVEVRNMAYPDHAWALRYEELRQRDAEKVVKGILDWAAR